MEKFIKDNSTVYILNRDIENIDLKIKIIDYILKNKDSYIKVGCSINYRSLTIVQNGKSFMITKILYDKINSFFDLYNNVFFEYNYNDYIAQKLRKKERTSKKIKNTKYNNKIISGEIKPININEWCIKNKAKLIKTSTKAEKKLFNALPKKIQRISEKQKMFNIDGKVYFADLYIKNKNIIIECDGSVHYTDENIKKDRKRDSDFKSIGITTIRIKNEDVFNKDNRIAFIESLKSII